MVKIDGMTTYSATRLRKKGDTKRASTKSFSVDTATNTPASVDIAGPQSPEEIASISQLMSLQEVTGSDHQQKQAMQSGESILQSLDQLQNQILTGHISKAGLKRILDLTNAVPQITDPNLKQIIAEIRQRAMIEIAKIEVSTGEDIL